MSEDHARRPAVGPAPADLPPADPPPACPPSAVSHAVGIAGLIGFGGWTLIARHYGMDGPHAGLAAVLACAVAMVGWSLLMDKVHRRAGTGIDWTTPRPLAETLDISIVKLTGLWTSWALVALFYMAGGWYWQGGGYAYAMDLLTMAAPVLVALSIPYVLWLDRRLADPRDEAHAFGQWLIGGAAGAPPPGAVAAHARAWAVKAFFLAFMLSIVPGNFAVVVNWRADGIMADPASLAGFLIALMFAVDVAFATAGYALTLRPLDAHIRSADPTVSGWVAALICYPPFVLMGPGGPLHYAVDTQGWDRWLASYPSLLWLWGALLVMLTAIYAWATVAFGPRFSNLTHRGILTHGPYRFTRHPAYLAKTLFWWLSVLPFLTVSGDPLTAARNTALLAATSAVYFWRARTEEAHLARDPAYRAYAAWMDRHGLIARLTRRANRPAMRPA